MHFSQYLYSANRDYIKRWLSLYKKPTAEDLMPDLVFIGAAIILVGFLVVFLSLMMASRSSESGERRTEVKGGGVILIGPIPIIFGSDAKWASIAIVLGIVLIILVLFSGMLVGP
jgi:uncharacterized protein (TIGR00304 family)